MWTISNSKRTMEASALLLLFSFFVLIEGTLRMTQYSKPMIDTDYRDDANGTQVPYGIMLACGCFEVLMGMIGMVFGFFQFFFELGYPRLTDRFAVLQFILGCFVFLTVVIAGPSMDAHHATGIPDVLSEKEHRVLLVFGDILSSVTFNFALLGGQLSMILHLFAAQTNTPVKLGNDIMQSIVWSLNIVVLAISTLYVGILLAAKDFTSTTIPVSAPPHLVWYPVISIVTGVIMLMYGVVGVFAAYNINAAQRLPFLWLIGFVTMLVNFSWTFGLEPGVMASPMAAQHTGIVLAMTFLPVFHAWRTHYPLDSSTAMMMTTTTVAEQPMTTTTAAKHNTGEDETEDMA